MVFPPTPSSGPAVRAVKTAVAGATFCAATLSSWGAEAASLQQVNGWGTGFPADVSMYAYVPDQVVENPPLVVLIHYCGGTAPDVFGQARDGGLVAAADQYGFVIIAPSSGRCWDVVSDLARAREGKGDPGAIRQMVNHAIDTYGANPDRVYSTGDSSGGMMTELLLGLYPDVFKGGSAMAGMPAACRGDGESGNGGGYSGACADGNVDRTPAEWGDIVRSLYPEFVGLRPRVQLFHGDADTIIDYRNHTEALEEWTNLLGLAQDPTSEDDGISVGNHPGLRQTWEGECGLPVLDGFTSFGGDHGPSDALFLAEYIVPFLGLDQTGPIDPYVEACMEQGMGGSGGSSGGGGTGGAGGQGGGGGLGSGGAPSGGTDAGGGASANGGAGIGGSGGSLTSGGGTAGGGSSTGGGSSGGSSGGQMTGAGGAEAASGGSSGVGGMAPATGGVSPGTGGGLPPSTAGGCSLARERRTLPGGLLAAGATLLLTLFGRQRRRARRV